MQTAHLNLSASLKRLILELPTIPTNLSAILSQSTNQPINGLPQLANQTALVCKL